MHHKMKKKRKLSTLTQVPHIIQRSCCAGPVDRSSDTEAAVMAAREE